MTRNQMIVTFIVYLIGIAVCTQWAVSLGWTRTLGLLLWTSFFAFCNAVSWATYWCIKENF